MKTLSRNLPSAFELVARSRSLRHWASVFFPGLALFLALPSPSDAAAPARQITRPALLDKIRGGWAGQMIGVSYGAPTEFRAQGTINDSPLTWEPGRVENSLHQDDLYVEMTFARVMDTLGLKATSRDYGRAFRDSKYDLWHANAAARRALNQGIDAPWSGHPKYNFHANDIDFQIEADFIGLMSPGLPRVSNQLCDRVGRVMNYGDGLYGGMFVGGMYAAAYFEDDPRKVVEAGLACIPARSEYGRLIRDVLDWSAQSPGDWRKVWQRLEDKCDKDDACPDGALSPFNIDAKLNGAYIAIGLLFGEKDFLKTMEIATRCGQDSDCNPSSTAGVLGVMLGFDKIPDQCKSGIAPLADKKFDFTEYSFNDIVKSTETRALQAIQAAGGRVTADLVLVPVQSPRQPRLEQWTPGKPSKRSGVADAAWTFTGPWKTSKEGKSANGAGGEATFKFNGVAAAILGRLSQEGGRAFVFLDGKKQKQLLDAYIVERTHDRVLWQVYGLKPGEHTLKIVTQSAADPRSRGTQILLNEAVVYGP